MRWRAIAQGYLREVEPILTVAPANAPRCYCGPATSLAWLPGGLRYSAGQVAQGDTSHAVCGI